MGRIDVRSGAWWGLAFGDTLTVTGDTGAARAVWDAVAAMGGEDDGRLALAVVEHLLAWDATPSPHGADGTGDQALTTALRALDGGRAGGRDRRRAGRRARIGWPAERRVVRRIERRIQRRAERCLPARRVPRRGAWPGVRVRLARAARARRPGGARPEREPEPGRTVGVPPPEGRLEVPGRITGAS